MAGAPPSSGFPSEPPAHWPARVPPPDPTPQPAPRGGATAIIAVAIVFALAVTYGLGQALARADDPGTRVPATLPATTTTAPVEGLVPLAQAVPALISFVEQERGSQFDRIPDVIPQSDIEYEATASDTIDRDIALTRHAVTYEALGVGAAEGNLRAGLRLLAARASVAVLDEASGNVIVRGEMTTPYTRANIVAALTRALDLQLPPADSPPVEQYDASFAVDALAAGSAATVAAAYVSQLNQADQASFAQDERQIDGLRGVSGAGQAAQFVDVLPTLVGRPFAFHLLAKPGGPRAVDRAFRSPPTTSAQVFAPSAYDDSTPPVALDRLPPPEGRLLDEGRYGFADLAVTLFPAIDLPSERDSGDEWAGGRFQTWQNLAGQLCVRVRVAGASDAATELLLARFEGWAGRVGPNASAVPVLDRTIGRSVIELNRCST